MLRASNLRGKFAKIVKQWWDGEYVPYMTDDEMAQSGVFFVGGQQRRHWSSHAANAVWVFLKKEWKWAFGASIALAGLAMTYIRLFH